jgi:2-polyprenyl-3-methyl-5-hydroxy-6-metoxy-1,4-benzoquinol methylase
MVMCDRCGHVYSNPQLDRAELTTLYRDIYRSASLGYADERPTDDYLYWKRRKAQRDYGWLNSHVTGFAGGRSASGRTALEIGCAEGLLLSLLAKDGWCVAGIEPTPTYAAHAREVYGIEVMESAFEDAALADRKFDLVIALAVFEHIKEPLSFLARIRDLLHPEGVIFLTVPDVLDLGDFPEERLMCPHLNLFMAETLRRTFAKAGFAAMHVGRNFDLLAGLAQPAPLPGHTAALEPPLPWHDVRRAIQTCRIRARLRKAGGRGVRGAKQALFRVAGPVLGDRIWTSLRASTGRPKRSVN